MHSLVFTPVIDWHMTHPNPDSLSLSSCFLSTSRFLSLSILLSVFILFSRHPSRARDQRLLHYALLRRLGVRGSRARLPARCVRGVSGPRLLPADAAALGTALGYTVSTDSIVFAFLFECVYLYFSVQFCI